MMTDTIIKDVEHLKAQMDNMKDTQDDIRDSIKEIAHALNELIMLRKQHDYHESELVKMRERSHKHANAIQTNTLKIEMLEKLPSQIDEIRKSETGIKINQAKSGVIISLITSVITAIAILSIKSKGG